MHVQIVYTCTYIILYTFTESYPRQLAKHEKLFFHDTRLEVVNNYCHLGFSLTTKLSCKQGTDHLAAKGKKAVIAQWLERGTRD